MYCPKCFNSSLSLSSRGIVHIIVNGKQMDAGRFVFNLTKEKKEEVQRKIHEKLEEFFEWYSTFKNKDPITRVAVASSDFVCSEHCQLDQSQKHSVIDLLIPKKEVLECLKRLGEKYGLHIELKLD